MRRRTFLKWLASLAVVPFLHAPVRESLADHQAASFLKKLNREPHCYGYRTGEMPTMYSTSPEKWIHAHGITYNGKLRMIPITGRFTS